MFIPNFGPFVKRVRQLIIIFNCSSPLLITPTCKAFSHALKFRSKENLRKTLRKGHPSSIESSFLHCSLSLNLPLQLPFIRTLSLPFIPSVSSISSLSSPYLTACGCTTHLPYNARLLSFIGDNQRYTFEIEPSTIPHWHCLFVLPMLCNSVSLHKILIPFGK